jgi:cephalosporin hydroxylase
VKQFNACSNIEYFHSATQLTNTMLKLLKDKGRILWRHLIHRLYINPKLEGDITNQFHKLYYDSHSMGRTWSNTWWMGHQIMKCPLDLWLHQEILFATKPDIIIETGTYKGGSAYYLASLCDLLGKGKVVSIDVEEYPNRPQHSRITYLQGSSVSDAILESVRAHIQSAGTSVLVILDSDHAKAHVRKEMELYGKLVSLGNYMIVEDSNVNAHPVYPEHGPGPMEAIVEFMPSHKEFENDIAMEKFLFSFNPKGYLKRVM